MTTLFRNKISTYPENIFFSVFMSIYYYLCHKKWKHFLSLCHLTTKQKKRENLIHDENRHRFNVSRLVPGWCGEILLYYMVYIDRFCLVTQKIVNKSYNFLLLKRIVILHYELFQAVLIGVILSHILKLLYSWLRSFTCSKKPEFFKTSIQF